MNELLGFLVVGAIVLVAYVAVEADVDLRVRIRSRVKGKIKK